MFLEIRRFFFMKTKFIYAEIIFIKLSADVKILLNLRSNLSKIITVLN